MYVDVPRVPGVPQVQRAPGFQDDPPELLNQDTVDTFGSPPAQQWGLFQNGSSVITADSVVAIDYKQEWDISDYPVEQGAFQSYNKVNTPFKSRVRFATGGSQEDRTALLNSIDAIAGNTELYDLVTPEIIKEGVNIEHYDYERAAANGVGLIMVDVFVLEIRNTATAAFSNTKAPSGASPVSNGIVQSQPPTGDQASKAVSAGAGGAGEGAGGGGGGGF